MTKKTEKQKLSFEQMMDRIKEITETLQRRDVGLEKSIDLYREGMELVKKCQQLLNEAEEKIKIITENEEGFEIQKVDASLFSQNNNS